MLLKGRVFLILFEFIAACSSINLSQTCNKFGVQLFSHLTKKASGNVIISPLSVHSAMTMVLFAASGASRDELLKSLQYASDDTQSAIQKSYKELYKEINTSQGIRIASRLYVSSNLKVKFLYNIICNQTFNSAAIPTDFAKAVESAKKINSWIETITNGKIRNMVASESLTKYVKIVLVNAIYFKENWKYQFDPKLTTLKDFNTADGTTQANFMQMKANLKFGALTIKGETNIAVELPYQSDTDNVSMFLITPMDQSSTDTSGIVENINLTQIVSCLKMNEIILEIPKFKIEFESQLEDVLAKMGITRIFSATSSQLTEMFISSDRDQQLVVDQIKHKAFIEIDESGTEAAAATIVNTRSMPIPITFNRPFVFIIAKNDEIPLFIGQVKDPKV